MRLGPAAVLVVDDRPYLVDCGEGAPRQLLRSGRRLQTVDHVFVTHHHFDHISDLGNFLVYAWFAGRTEPVDVWGPPPIEELLDDVVRLYATSCAFHVADGGLPPFDRLPRAHAIAVDAVSSRGVEVGVEVMADERITVRACPVRHGDAPTLAFRFRTPDADVVFGADRGFDGDALVDFARGADVLVHEVLHLPTMRQLYAGWPEAVFDHFRRNHTSPEDVGRTAAAAGVRTVVVNHVLPDAASPSLDEWRAMVATEFDGDVVVGTDLLEIPLPGRDA